MVNFLLVCLQQNLQCYILDIYHILLSRRVGFHVIPSFHVTKLQ